MRWVYLIMKTNIKKFYRTSEDFLRYSMKGEKRLKNIKRLYLANKIYFGNNILDIACGGGILGFLVEKDKKRYKKIYSFFFIFKKIRYFFPVSPSGPSSRKASSSSWLHSDST